MLNSYVLTAGILFVSLAGLWVAVPHIAIWLLIAELFWVGLYVFYALLGMSLDALHIAVWCFFILCLATSESAIGLSLLIFNFFKTGNVHGAKLTLRAMRKLGSRTGAPRK